MRGAIAGGHHCDVISSTHAPIGSLVAQECGALSMCRAARRSFARSDVRWVELFEAHIVNVNVLTCGDGPRGETNHIPIAMNGASGNYRENRNLVSGRDRVSRNKRCSIYFKVVTGRKSEARDRNVIIRIQQNDGTLSSRWFFDFVQHAGDTSTLRRPPLQFQAERNVVPA